MVTWKEDNGRSWKKYEGMKYEEVLHTFMKVWRKKYEEVWRSTCSGGETVGFCRIKWNWLAANVRFCLEVWLHGGTRYAAVKRHLKAETSLQWSYNSIGCLHIACTPTLTVNFKNFGADYVLENTVFQFDTKVGLEMWNLMPFTLLWCHDSGWVID